MQFRFRFYRYDAKGGKTRLSGWTATSADNFAGAVRVAEAMLGGMQGADPVRKYSIAGVEVDSVIPNDGEGQSYLVGIWETSEEFSARVNATLAPKD